MNWNVHSTPHLTHFLSALYSRLQAYCRSGCRLMMPSEPLEYRKESSISMEVTPLAAV